MNGITLTANRPGQQPATDVRVFELHHGQPAQPGAESERSGSAEEQWMRLAVWSITRAVL